MLICQLTDLHVRAPGAVVARVSETNMLTERAFRRVAALRPTPDAVVITGDLTEVGSAAEYANFRRLIGKYLTMPVYVIPGNHDRRGELRAALPDLPGVITDPVYVRYAVDLGPVRLAMLDTLVPGSTHGELGPEQLDWLDRTLSAASEEPTIVGMHHPPFACGIAHVDKINLRDAGAFAAVIARHPQVERIICGHHHRPIVGRVAHAIAMVAPSVAHQIEFTLDPGDRGAFLFEPPAFQIHRWTAADGFVSHTVYVEEYPGPFPFLAASDYPGRP